MQFSLGMYKYTGLREFEFNYYRNHPRFRRILNDLRDICIEHNFPPPTGLDVQTKEYEVVDSFHRFFGRVKKLTEKRFDVHVNYLFELDKETDVKVARMLLDTYFKGMQLGK